MSIDVPDQKKAATELATFIGKALHADSISTDEIIEFTNVFLKRAWLEGSQVGFERGAEVVRAAITDIVGTL